VASGTACALEEVTLGQRGAKGCRQQGNNQEISLATVPLHDNQWGAVNRYNKGSERPEEDAL